VQQVQRGRDFHFVQHPITRQLFQRHVADGSFRVGNYDPKHFFVCVTHLQCGLFIELWQFRSRAGDRDLGSAIARSGFLSFSGKAMQAFAIIRLGLFPMNVPCTSGMKFA
jgi:hypothetical protein